jgi:hypothetical protein
MKKILSMKQLAVAVTPRVEKRKLMIYMNPRGLPMGIHSDLILVDFKNSIFQACLCKKKKQILIALINVLGLVTVCID